MRSCWAGVLAGSRSAARRLRRVESACKDRGCDGRSVDRDDSSVRRAGRASGDLAARLGRGRPAAYASIRATNTYIVSRGGAAHHGTFSVDGDTIEFTSTCSDTNQEGVGRYRWTLEGDILHFELIGKDECSGRSAVLEDATYERSG